MTSMQEIIELVSAKLGVPESTARDGIKILLRFAQKQIPEADFQKLIARIPGAAELLTESLAAPAAAPASGLFGGLGALLGGQAGAAAQALSELQAAGIEMAQIAPFMQFFVEKAREVAGPETVDMIFKEIPILQGFLKPTP
jgi:Protein of unknown function VcgC/VcgE (DUF2780)